ncbi:MAG: aminotransferase class I/II-fold pyridoxal phosphate-dependent enzyme [Clostridia bacterium]|nr:aminotransferase class I/II-fold pyridoxal phosphate-dependent enzyme [Clostridia bacterium]
MLVFESDYTEGASPEILQHLVETNKETLVSYGLDKYSSSAKEKIKKACGKPSAEVFLLTGGTQTNQIVIDTVLAPYEGVISADTGHVNAHEAGAIEFTGHKVLTVPHENGKIMSSALTKYLETYYADETHEHIVRPGMVYISHPTEYGTLYTKDELYSIANICRKYDIPLYLDGARLGYGLMSRGTDVTLEVIADACDVFYIGGTKVGALCGEAVVFTHANAPRHFFSSIKQHGALLAKGRLVGVQFDAMFTDDLYFRLGAHAIKMADKVREILREKGYRFYIETVTNQIFVELTPEEYKKVTENVKVGFWERTAAGNTVVRFATSWSTREENVEALRVVL